MDLDRHHLNPERVEAHDPALDTTLHGAEKLLSPRSKEACRAVRSYPSHGRCTLRKIFSNGRKHRGGRGANPDEQPSAMRKPSRRRSTASEPLMSRSGRRMWCVVERIPGGDSQRGDSGMWPSQARGDPSSPSRGQPLQGFPLSSRRPHTRACVPPTRVSTVSDICVRPGRSWTSWTRRPPSSRANSMASMSTSLAPRASAPTCSKKRIIGRGQDALVARLCRMG